MLWLHTCVLLVLLLLLLLLLLQFIVAGGGTRRYVVCVGGVRAFDKPETYHTERTGERPSARLRHGATVTVVAQERDWLKVRAAKTIDWPHASSVRSLCGTKSVV